MRKPVFVLLVPLLSVLLAISVLEGLARLYFWHAKNATVDRQLSATAQEQGVSAETFNIYYFGDSTMQGEPFNPQMSIPKITEYLLQHKLQGKPIRSVNLGRSSTDLAYSLDLIRRILARKAEYHPSLIVLYSGHNEFLKYCEGFDPFPPAVEQLIRFSLLAEKVGNRFRSYRLESADRALFDKPLFGKEKYAAVIQEYKNHLAETVRLLREAHLPGIISTAASNYADWQPNRSVYCSEAGDAAHFSRLLKSGQEAQREHRYGEAVHLYRQALADCESFAEAHYLLANSYQAMQEPEKAKPEYYKAVQYDRVPIRTSPEQNDFIRGLAKEPGIEVIDSVQALENEAGNGLVGFNLMADGHHPNVKGFLIVSRLVAAAAIHSAEPHSRDLALLDEEQARLMFGIDRKRTFEVFTSVGRWMTRMATWRYDPAERLRLAEEHFMQAIAIDPEQCEEYMGLAMVNSLRKNVIAAQGNFDKAKAIDPVYAERYIRQPWVKSVLRYSSEKRP